MSLQKFQIFFLFIGLGLIVSIGVLPVSTGFADTAPLSDRAKGLDANGNGLIDRDEARGPLDANFDEMLKTQLARIYDNIVLGDTKSAFANVDEGFKLRLKNAHSRVLFFKDADSWLNYNKQYGKDILESSPYVPNRAIIFDGEIKHTIKAQNIMGPSYRFTT